jgi:hypothetical protein
MTPHLQAVPDESPYKEYRRPIAVILADLSKPIPKKYLDTRKQGTKILTFVPWFNVAKLLDRCAPGWEGSITHIEQIGDRLVLTYRLTIHAQESSFTREATGQESLNCASYGDPSSNAESMAFRRAAAKFGLGLYLYEKD